MADEQQSFEERTESPTPRRREQARSEGRVAKSAELGAAAGLLGGALMLATLGGTALAVFSREVLVASAGVLGHGPMTALSAVSMLRVTALQFTLAVLPFALAVMGTVVLTHLAQTRGAVSWKPLEPKLSNLSPVKGIRRMFSPEAAFNLAKQTVKLAVLGFATWLVIAGGWPELVSLAHVAPATLAGVLTSLALRLAVITGLAFLAVSLIDYGFQWLRTEKSLRMTRQEVMREHKETEGDPIMKGRIRAIARARARRRMLQQVPRADVVVVNPTRIAVALRYDADLAPAPIVVAMGERKVAERIREIANQAGVPIAENQPVARALLATATVGKPIPAALYIAVAEILAFVYRRRGVMPAGLGGPRSAA
jgi:flagellar biosynthetic protein FlhB